MYKFLLQRIGYCKQGMHYTQTFILFLFGYFVRCVEQHIISDAISILLSTDISFSNNKLYFFAHFYDIMVQWIYNKILQHIHIHIILRTENRTHDFIGFHFSGIQQSIEHHHSNTYVQSFHISICYRIWCMFKYTMHTVHSYNIAFILYKSWIRILGFTV